MLVYVRPEQVPLVWEKAEPYIEKAFNTCAVPIDMQQTYLRLLEGRLRIFLVRDGDEVYGVLLASIREGQMERVMNVEALSVDGELRNRDENFKALDDLALNCGCDYIEMITHHWLERRLKAHGYKKAKVQFIKDLGDIDG